MFEGRKALRGILSKRVHGHSTLLRRLSLGFFVVALAEAAGLWAATFWALSDLSQLTAELVEITRSLDATRDLSHELGRLLLHSQQLGGNPAASTVVRSSLTEVRMRLEGCASSQCHGSRSNPAEMVASIWPGFQTLAGSFEAAISDDSSPDQLVQWRSNSRLLIEDAQERISRMSSALLERVEGLREASHEVPNRARRNFLLLISAGIGLAWAAASFSASRLLQPLARLLVAIRSTAKGRLPQKVETGGPEEIQELARSFNEMVTRLEQYRSDLKEANRTLERRVEERTEELKRSQEVLYRSEKLAAIGLLTSGIGHEINNPLTGIAMNVDLMMEEEEPGSKRRLELQKISQDVERCRHIIDDLREFSRERALSKVEVDLMQLVQRTLRLSDVLIQRRKVEFRCHESEVLLAMCDPGRIQQVFTNVVLNALDAMPQGGVLEVRGTARNGYAVISFSDNGCGIPAQNLSRVFDPFFTTKPQGTGLGLSISYGIVAEHGGRIEIESRSGEETAQRGTTVSVSLPLVEKRA